MVYFARRMDYRAYTSLYRNEFEMNTSKAPNSRGGVTPVWWTVLDLRFADVPSISFHS
jgi:hypothetical protein